MSGGADEIEMQRRYYAETADAYGAMHVNEMDEHFFALAFLSATIDRMRIRSILDIGSGTGRAIHYLRKRHPDLRIIGVEPVKELREIAYTQGLSEQELIEGDATNLRFAAGEFDLVCEFGVLHHVKTPEIAIAEMLRVAGKAIFISDSNNFGQGSRAGRFVKQMVNLVGLWRLLVLIRTRGKGFTISAGDGLGYSYSVFNNYKLIKSRCSSIHLCNTEDAGPNLYRTAGHVALLGIKK